MKKLELEFVSSMLLGVALAAVVAPALGAKPVFFAHLNGRLWMSRVDPNAVYEVDTLAQGQAIFRYDPDEQQIVFTLVVSNIEDITMAHIHVDDGMAVGPIVVWLYPRMPPPIEIPGRFNGILAAGTINADNLEGPLSGMTIADLVAQIGAGHAYVVVHTAQHLPGEIRGWIM